MFLPFVSNYSTLFAGHSTLDTDTKKVVVIKQACILFSPSTHKHMHTCTHPMASFVFNWSRTLTYEMIAITNKIYLNQKILISVCVVSNKKAIEDKLKDYANMTLTFWILQFNRILINVYKNHHAHHYLVRKNDSSLTHSTLALCFLYLNLFLLRIFFTSTLAKIN